MRHWACTHFNRAPHKCSLSIRKRNPETGAEDEVTLTDEQLKITLDEYGVGQKLEVVIKQVVDVTDGSYLAGPNAG